MDHVKKISEHFWIIEENGVRVFLFEGEKQALLIDTGFGTIALHEIISSLTNLPVIVVNTHADRDHIGANKDFQQIYMHPSEMDRYQSSSMEKCSMEKIHPLWEGNSIDLGIWKFEVILTPGHTPGSIMLLEKEKRMLICGDSIQDGNIFMFGAGRNMTAYQNSLQKMIDLSDSFDSIWPSHGSYPLNKEIIPQILQGTKDLLEGKLIAEEAPNSMPCKKYSCSVASFLF